MMNRIIIISGPIGSGKSTACKYVAKLGFKYINSDDLAKSIIKYNTKVHFELSKLLDIKSTFQRVPWAKIRNTIFYNSEIKDSFDNIIHPIFYKKLDKIIDSKNNFVIEIPLIETIYNIKKNKTIISILSEKSKRKDRVLSRNKIDDIMFNKIDNLQKNNDYYKKYSDHIIHNNGMIEKLYNNLNNIIKKNV